VDTHRRRRAHGTFSSCRKSWSERDIVP
jgi:hypothetical protein